MIQSYPGKRVLDLILALIMLVLLAPLIMIVALMVLLAHGRPVFFRQERPGLHGRSFNMYKFRSMTNATDADGNPLAPSGRVTRLGKFLRMTSLDEVPELLNVVRGEMSLVGPRPLLMDYLKYYSAHQMHRHDAKPGITGWAQVNGRNSLSWEEKFCLDIWYVERVSMNLDLRILAMTALSVVRARDINKKGLGHEGSEYFRGSRPAKPAQRL